MATGRPEREAINAALAEWRQGDCVLGEHWFVFAVDESMPLTPEAVEAGGSVVAAEVRGLMVATQSCDIVRACEERPFLELCPLVEVDGVQLQEISKGRRPNYAFVPGVAADLLVADLDRVMTVEKAVVISWARRVGCSNDYERRVLAKALARKRERPAFPDDFTPFVSKLQKRLVEKHDKASEDGRALRALREIRVGAYPSWDAENVSLMFWFIRDEDMGQFEDRRWHELLDAWMKLIQPAGRFTADGVVVTLPDMTAADYVNCDRLDLEYLSLRPGH